MSDNDTYRVVYGDEFDAFVATVNGLMREGWTPQGGVHVRSVDDGERILYQAMTRPASAADPLVPTAEEIDLARTGRKLDAIRSYRYRTDADLKTAKDVIDRVGLFG